VDFCSFSESGFDRQDQVFKLDGVALTKIKNIEQRARIFQSSHRSLNYVVDVSVVASGCAVPELLDRLPGVNTTREWMDRQSGPLPWTVHGKVTQRDDA